MSSATQLSAPNITARNAVDRLPESASGLQCMAGHPAQYWSRPSIPRVKGGRSRMAQRARLSSILVVLRSTSLQ